MTTTGPFAFFTRRHCITKASLMRQLVKTSLTLAVLLSSVLFAAGGAFLCRPSRLSSWSSSSARLHQSTAGQGGGIFYDGPENNNENKERYEKAMRHAATSSSSSSSSSSFPPLSSSFPNHRINKNVVHKDVVVIGGGLAGLSCALYLSQLRPELHITVLDREDLSSGGKKEQSKSTVMASMAAAGMLAPYSERLPRGPLLDLCCQSRHLYADFCHLVESLAQEETVSEYLYKKEEEDPMLSKKETSSSSSSSLPPWSVGYVASGGFLAPAFAGDAVATWAPPTLMLQNDDEHNDEHDGKTCCCWLDQTQVHELEPHLHPDVIGGWWFPSDASVDARRLTCSLRAACVSAGVDLQSGVEVTSLDLVMEDDTCRGVWCNQKSSSSKTGQSSSKYLKTNQVLVANGAWMRQLLPVPLEPHKGQSLSLRMPSDRPPLLRRVLFAQDSYIVPKADGRIVVGATVEAGSYDPNVTPAGLLHVLSHALELVPGLADLPVEETWVGLRPTTPDKGPILGRTPWKNLFLAGGYWRNGVLLAPKTGQLLAMLMSGTELSEADQALLEAFSWDRFTSQEGGAKLAANARYAASMHPIHRRASGAGVAAAVGTELGSYSTARAAAEERRMDRQALFGGANEDSLEQAAMLGRQDANAFDYDSDESREKSTGPEALSQQTPLLSESNASSLPKTSFMEANTTPYEGSPDALTIGSSPAEEEEDEKDDQSKLQSVYEAIRTNQQSRQVELMESPSLERPDPGFRLYHLDAEAGLGREVPPYTSPEDMERIVARSKETGIESTPVVPAPAMEESGGGDSILDGYRTIQDASGGISNEEAVQKMRESRMRARQATEIDASADMPQLGSKPVGHFESEDPTLNQLYEKIRENKLAASVEMPEGTPDERPDPGFRIYYVDAKTGEYREVPPYTRPEEMERLIAKEEASLIDCTSHGTNGSFPASETEIEPIAANGSISDANKEEYSEQTYDGYQAIQQANAGATRGEELEAMRAARRKNRFLEDVDVSQIGAERREVSD